MRTRQDRERGSGQAAAACACLSDCLERYRHDRQRMSHCTVGTARGSASLTKPNTAVKRIFTSDADRNSLRRSLNLSACATRGIAPNMSSEAQIRTNTGTR